MSMIEIQLYNLFRNDLNLSEIKAQEFIQAIKEVFMSHNEKNTEKFATNAFVKDEVNRLELKIEKTRTDLVKAIYWAGIIQYIAIIASLIGILNFMMRGK